MGFNLSELFETIGVQYWASGKNVARGYTNISCPFCGDRSNHMGVSNASGNFRCWKCPAEGSIYELAMELKNCDIYEAKRIVRPFRIDGLGRMVKEEKIIKEFRNIMPQFSYPIKDIDSEASSPYADYLIDRDFDPETTIKKYNLYAGGIVGKYKWRIIVPIIYQGQIVNFVARAISADASKKVVNCPNEECVINAKNILFNLDNVINRKMIICEGVFDAMRVGDGAVATLGTEVTDAQINLIRQYADTVHILFDSYEKDKRAPQQADKLASRLSGVIGHVEIWALKKGDPCDMSNNEVKELRREMGI